MESMFYLVCLVFIIVAGIGTLSLVIIQNTRLKRLVRIIDVMAYVTNGVRPYDVEIVEIANKLSLSTIKSVQGNFSSRYVNLINKLDAYGLGRFLYDHDQFIDNAKKRHYLINIIRKNISELPAVELGKMLSEIISFVDRDYVNIYQISSSNETIKNLILEVASKMEPGRLSIFMASFDNEIKIEFNFLESDVTGNGETWEKSKSLLNADYIRISERLTRGF